MGARILDWMATHREVASAFVALDLSSEASSECSGRG